jgi:hypothetical protein
MAQAPTHNQIFWTNNSTRPQNSHYRVPRNVDHINAIHWDHSLQPKHYEISGTDPDSKILFLDVNIVDSTGAEPYRGDVLVEGEDILEALDLLIFSNDCPSCLSLCSGEYADDLGIHHANS